MSLLTCPSFKYRPCARDHVTMLRYCFRYCIIWSTCRSDCLVKGSSFSTRLKLLCLYPFLWHWHKSFQLFASKKLLHSWVNAAVFSWQLTCLVLPHEHGNLLQTKSIWSADKAIENCPLVEHVLHLDPIEVCSFISLYGAEF